MNQKMSIMELPPSDRPRERLFSEGPQWLSDLELVCLLLGSGSKGHPVQALARRVLMVLDSPKGNGGQVDFRMLASIPGLGRAKSAVLAAALELGRRRSISSRRSISTPGDVFPFIRHFGDREQEHFLCVLLNGAHEVMDVRVSTVGLVNRTLVHPREVFSDAIKARACAVILAHNHPSGNLEPSAQDIEVTREMLSAGKLLGIRVLDHLIFNGEGYCSLLESGLLEGEWSREG